jgi:phage-related protein
VTQNAVPTKFVQIFLADLVNRITRTILWSLYSTVQYRTVKRKVRSYLRTWLCCDLGFR